MTLKNFITNHHKSTKRNYLNRMNDNKVECMIISKKYDIDSWITMTVSAIVSRMTAVRRKHVPVVLKSVVVNKSVTAISNGWRYIEIIGRIVAIY